MVANALLRLGSVHQTQGDVDAAVEIYDEAMALLKSSSNRQLVDSIKNNVALMALESGNYRQARDILEECVADARNDGDAAELDFYLDSLAWAHLGLGDHQGATASWRETLSHSRSVLDNVSVVFNLYGLSSAASARGDDERALRLQAAATHLAGDRFSSSTWLPKLSQQWLGKSRARLGPQKSQAAWNEGWSLTVEQATDYALSETEPEDVVASDRLSRRQREVATLVAAGLTNREIGERLFIAERSAEGHVERIRNKLGVRSRTEVATWAVEHGLTDEPRKDRGTHAGPLRSRRGEPG
jgi:non-specific serine/threonine protein kinase